MVNWSISNKQKTKKIQKRTKFETRSFVLLLFAFLNATSQTIIATLKQKKALISEIQSAEASFGLWRPIGSSFLI